MIKVEIVGGSKNPNRLHQIVGFAIMLVALALFVVFTVQFLFFIAPIIVALILFSIGIYIYNKK